LFVFVGTNIQYILQLPNFLETFFTFY